MRPKLFLVRVREGIYSLSVLTAAEMHTDARVRVRVRVRGRVCVRVCVCSVLKPCQGVIFHLAAGQKDACWLDNLLIVVNTHT